MTKLPGNPFASTHKINGTASEDDGDWAIAQATLALAYEQRTANMIAYMHLGVIAQTQGTNIEDDIADEIMGRLRLGENND